MSVIHRICEEQRALVHRRRREVSLEALREAPRYHGPTHSLAGALRAAPVAVIAEHKRASPSQGSYGVTLSPEAIARGYAEAGACAISVLTEENHFGGSLAHLRAIRACVDVPLLRKDFIVDAYQLHEAKAHGADAVLLIAAALTLDEAHELRTVAHHLSLEVLLEVHDAAELDYLDIGPDVVGVNNRNLRTLNIDLRTSETLAASLPGELVRITESGIGDAAAAARLLRFGYDGMLVGTQFMRTPKPAAALSTFLTDVRERQAAASC